MTSRCTGVILAGGRARRFDGKPKGLETVGGERIIDRIARALRDVTDSQIIITDSPQGSTWIEGVSAYPDVLPELGALSGLYSALRHAESDVIVVAWDMPFVPAALLGRLREIGESSPDVMSVLPENPASRRGAEPLCAWYSARALSSALAAIESGDRRAIALSELVGKRIFTIAESRAFGDPAMMFRNINTPEDLREVAE